MARQVARYNAGSILFLMFHMIAWGLWARDEQVYRTEEEKAQLWSKLGLEYAGQNVIHKYLDTLNLVKYFKKNKNKPIHIDSTVMIVPDKKIIKNRYLRQLKNIFSPGFFMIEKEGKKTSIDGIYIKNSSSIGLGAYAARKYKKGELIGEYTGEIRYYPGNTTTFEFYSALTQGRDFETDIFPAIFLDSSSDYVLRYLEEHPYFFVHGHQSEKIPLIIDSKKYRNEISFINNSRFPNIQIQRVIKIIVTEQDPEKITAIKVAAFAEAMSNIEENEELLMNYQYPSQIYQEKKFIDYRPGNACYSCQSPNTTRCSKCKIAYYCSRECQVADWSQHKIFCHSRP